MRCAYHRAVDLVPVEAPHLAGVWQPRRSLRCPVRLENGLRCPYVDTLTGAEEMPVKLRRKVRYGREARYEEVISGPDDFPFPPPPGGSYVR